jgi:hypothetical protein
MSLEVPAGLRPRLAQIAPVMSAYLTRHDLPDEQRERLGATAACHPLQGPWGNAIVASYPHMPSGSAGRNGHGRELIAHRTYEFTNADFH